MDQLKKKLRNSWERSKRRIKNTTESKHRDDGEVHCPQCEIPFTNDDVCMTPCGHRFCRTCIESCLRAPGKPCYECGVMLSEYTVVWCKYQKPLKMGDTETIFGSSFIQLGTVGLESFHFDVDKCFIRYDQNVVPKYWRLDNGDRLPRKKYFRDWKWDKEDRMFTGFVHWEKDATYRGSVKTLYELHFDEWLDEIVGGQAIAYFDDGSCRKVQTFGNDRSKLTVESYYRRVAKYIYGNTYVRLPAPKECPDTEKTVQTIASLVHEELGASMEAGELMAQQELQLKNLGDFSLHFAYYTSYIDFSSIPGKNHPRRKHFQAPFFDPLTRTFTGTIHSPDCRKLLTHHSEWKLQFNETLERIESGTIRHYDKDGMLVHEQVLHWKPSPSNKHRYLMVLPWQTADPADIRINELLNHLELAKIASDAI